MGSKVATGSTTSTFSQPPIELNDIQKANVDWKDVWFGLIYLIGLSLTRNWGGFFVKLAKKVVASMCMLMKDQPTLKFQLCKIIQKLMK